MGIFPTQVPVHHVDAKRASDPIGLELQMVMWLLGMNLGPLQEESVLLTPVLFVWLYIIQAGLKVLGSTDPSDSGSYGPGTTSSKYFLSCRSQREAQFGIPHQRITFMVI